MKIGYELVGEEDGGISEDEGEDDEVSARFSVTRGELVADASGDSRTGDEPWPWAPAMGIPGVAAGVPLVEVLNGVGGEACGMFSGLGIAVPTLLGGATPALERA